MIAQKEIRKDSFICFRTLFGLDKFRPNRASFFRLSVFFHIKTDGDSLIGRYLEYDTVLIKLVLLVIENGRIFSEFYNHPCFFLGKCFSGSQIDRYALEPPIVNLEAKSGKCFRPGRFRYSSFVLVPCVLTENDMRYKIFPESERADDFYFLVMNSGACESMGRFHRSKSKYLKEVILHHIPKCSGMIVISSTVFHTKRFGGGDLDIVDIMIVPNGFEERVRKTESEDVLNRLLPDIVIDSKNLIFRKSSCNECV